MPFVLKTKKEIWWPVTIHESVDGGTTEARECSSLFEILEPEEYETWKTKPDVDFLCHVVKDLGRDVKFEDGTIVPSTEENKKRLFKSFGYVRAGYIRAYHEAATGHLEKN